MSDTSTAPSPDLSDWLHWSPSLRRWMIRGPAWVLSDERTVAQEVTRRMTLSKGAGAAQQLLAEFQAVCEARAEPADLPSPSAQRVNREFTNPEGRHV